MVGLVGAFATTRLIQNMLFGVDSFDGKTLGGVGVVLMTVAVGSAVLPALKAIQVDPSVTLRED